MDSLSLFFLEVWKSHFSSLRTVCPFFLKVCISKSASHTFRPYGQFDFIFSVGKPVSHTFCPWTLPLARTAVRRGLRWRRNRRRTGWCPLARGTWTGWWWRTRIYLSDRGGGSNWPCGTKFSKSARVCTITTLLSWNKYTCFILP